MSSPRVLVIEHQAMCPPAHVGDWLAEAGVGVEVCRPYAGDTLPDLREYDGLLVLGGAMSAYDDEVHHWLGPVKELIREASATNVPTMGICLGNQLIAVALGGEVRVNPRGQQLGLLDVGWLPAADEDQVMAPTKQIRGIHWNNDVVGVLPEGAELLATADGDVQVVRFATTVWGLQLHPEIDEHVVVPWAEGDREEHQRRGVDQAALIVSIKEARAEMDSAWRPVFERFAGLMKA
ncbi:MAG: type 1 glutamine amidotransferase [Nocardioides sp.]|nr:type 1 glutamine amidotransferase [Nocardioides sp.]